MRLLRKFFIIFLLFFFCPYVIHYETAIVIAIHTANAANEDIEMKNTLKNVGIFDFETHTVLLNSGYTMPLMGLGTYSLSDNECYQAVTVLLNSGGRLIDTAYFYRNEAAVGRALRDSHVPREEIFVITKRYPNQFKTAQSAIEEALKKMDIGYIDMMLLHHPGEYDIEAYHAMEHAVQKGKYALLAYQTGM